MNLDSELTGISDGTAAVSDSSSNVHASRAFSLITRYLAADERKHDILDLGPPRIDNIEFLSRFGCKIHVEHIADALTDLNAMPTRREQRIAEIGQHLSGMRTRFDVILAWDLLNYLEPVAMSALLARIAEFCRKGTALFALVRIDERMPHQPSAFSCVDDKHLSYTVHSKYSKRCPQYSVVELMNQLHGFTVLRTYLMENGMHEYLLTFRRRS